jgi:hypothetical protein
MSMEEHRCPVCEESPQTYGREWKINLPVSGYSGTKFEKGDTTKLKEVLAAMRKKIDKVMKDHLAAEARNEREQEAERREEYALELGKHLLENVPEVTKEDLNKKFGIKEPEPEEDTEA